MDGKVGERVSDFFLQRGRKQVEDLLEHGERILLIVHESAVGSEGKFAPATLFATNRKMILSRNLFFTRTFEILKYEYITHTELKHGIFYSTVTFGLQFEHRTAEQKERWMITGLSKHSAVVLINFVEKMRQIKELREEKIKTETPAQHR